MDLSLRLFDLLVVAQVYLGMRYLAWLVAFHERARKRLDRRLRRLRGSIRALLRRWL